MDSLLLFIIWTSFISNKWIWTN